MESVKNKDLINFDEVDKLGKKMIFPMMEHLSSKQDPDNGREQIKVLSGVFEKLQLGQLLNAEHEIHKMRKIINNYNEFIENKGLKDTLTLDKAIKKYGTSGYIGLVGDEFKGYNIIVITQYDQSEALRNALIRFYPGFSQEFWWRIPKIFYLQNTDLEQMILSVLNSVNSYVEIQSQTAKNFNAFIFYHPQILLEIIKCSNGNYRKIEVYMGKINDKIKDILKYKENSPRFALVGFDDTKREEVLKIVRSLCIGEAINNTENISQIVEVSLLTEKQIEDLIFKGYKVTLKFADKNKEVFIFPFAINQSIFNNLEEYEGFMNFSEEFKEKIIKKIRSKNYNLDKFCRYYADELISYIQNTYDINVFSIWERIIPNSIIGYKDFNIVLSDIGEKIRKKSTKKPISKDMVIKDLERDCVDDTQEKRDHSNFKEEPQTIENKLISVLREFVNQKQNVQKKGIFS